MSVKEQIGDDSAVISNIGEEGGRMILRCELIQAGAMLLSGSWVMERMASSSSLKEDALQASSFNRNDKNSGNMSFSFFC